MLLTLYFGLGALSAVSAPGPAAFSSSTRVKVDDLGNLSWEIASIKTPHANPHRHVLAQHQSIHPHVAIFEQPSSPSSARVLQHDAVQRIHHILSPRNHAAQSRPQPSSRLQPAQHSSNALYFSRLPFSLNPVVCMPHSNAKYSPLRPSMLQSFQPISRPAPRRHAGHAARSATGSFLLPHRG